MNPSNPSSRRNQKAQPRAELLETRSLMTGGAGNTFAMVPATIAEAGGSVQVPFTINAPQFNLPKGKIALGIDVVPSQESNAQPLISQVDSPHEEPVPQTFHSIYNPQLPREQVARGVGTRAVITPLTFFPNQPARAATYNATVEGLEDSSGDVLVGFYLPGDADGSGVVDQADQQLVRSRLGAVAGDSRYDFDSDANRDGRIGPIDLAYTKQNQGVSTVISPVVTADFDPASDTGIADRITDQRVVHFSGAASPGATITYAEASQKSPEVTTTADADGRYNIHVTLGDGVNTFRVTSVDAFGQTIKGQIASVTFSTNPPRVPSSLRA